MARLDFDEAWNDAHDPQRAPVLGYCSVCGREIYDEVELSNYDGMCDFCYGRYTEAMEEAAMMANEEDGSL